MIGDTLLVDGVVHGFNWKPDNWAIPESEATLEPAAGFHRFLAPNDASRLTSNQWLGDWDADDLEELLILETPLDLVVYHGTPIFDFFKDGHSASHKGYELKRRHPDRVIVYGGVNPFSPTALEEVEQHAEMGADGIKVYAARWENGKTQGLPLNDPELGYPFIEKVRDCGINVVSTHKAVPFGPSHPDPYNVADMPEVLSVFPDMKFEIVHAGFAFVEETAFLATHPNCYFNLEASQSFIVPAPRRFADFMGKFLSVGAEDKIIFGTGCPLAHPTGQIEFMMNFEMPQDLVEGYAYPEFTDEIKRKVLGLNVLEMLGIDEQELRGKLDDDEWARRRKEEGMKEPFTARRAAKPEEAVV